MTVTFEEFQNMIHNAEEAVHNDGHITRKSIFLGLMPQDYNVSASQQTEEMKEEGTNEMTHETTNDPHKISVYT